MKNISVVNLYFYFSKFYEFLAKEIQTNRPCKVLQLQIIIIKHRTKHTNAMLQIISILLMKQLLALLY